MEIEEMLREFVDPEEDYIVYTNGTFNASAIVCKITKIGKGCIKIKDNTENVSVINLKNVIRIREYPKNKNGKKKAIFD